MALRVLNNTQLDAIQKDENGEPIKQEVVIPELIRYVMTCWDKAKTEKETIKDQILANMRQINGEYDAQKLSALKAAESPEIFMNITATKHRHALAWLFDLLFQPGQKAWGIEPTPIPELPTDIASQMYEAMAERVVMAAVEQAMSLGKPVDIEKVNNTLAELMDVIHEEALSSMNRVAKEKAGEMTKLIDDQLTEGGFYPEFRDTLGDIITHTGILKGPIPRKIKYKTVEKDPKSGRARVKMKEKVINTYERRHPLFIYPAPGAKSFKDGYLIDHITLTPKKLQGLIGQKGFREKEIREILDLAGGGSLKGWLDTGLVEQEIRDLNQSGIGALWDSDNIDCLEFWGAIKGSMLREWGINKKKVPDDQFWYDCTVWIINGRCIKAVLNSDVVGEKPYSKVSYIEKPESFWGMGLPQVIADVQQLCNACARAIMANIAIASGPQVERNIDRIPAADIGNNKLTPWRVWDVTETAMSTAPAMKFYQPPMVVERLIQVYQVISKLADDHSGIPAYAHGDARVGGAGNTASGLSMLITSAARGIKLLISEMDEKLIAPSIKRQYYRNLEAENVALVCDFEIVARGASAVLVKEQMATRRLEALQLTNNPLDVQILGMEGRKGMLRDVLTDLGIDVDKYLPEDRFGSLLSQQVPMPMQPGGPAQPGMITQGPQSAPPAGPTTLDASGAPAVGMDVARPTGQNS